MPRLSATVLLVSLLAANVQTQAQEATPLPSQAEIEQRMCAETPCQRNVRIALKRKDGTAYERTFPVFPAIVQGFGITVVAGQTINVEAGVEGDRLVNLRPVAAVADPAVTITATFEQMKDGGMMLKVHNPFGRPVKFRMGIMPLDGESLYPTTSCPIAAGKDSYELWPEPIFQVVLSDGRLLEQGVDMACVE